MADGRKCPMSYRPLDPLAADIYPLPTRSRAHVTYFISTSNDPSLTPNRASIIVNDARALRVAEIMNDFRTLQYHISQQKTTPSSEDYHKEGYALMRQCAAEAQTLLSSQYNPGTSQNAGGGGEKEKAQLQR